MFRRLVPLCLVAVLAACGGSDPATPVAAPAVTAAPTVTDAPTASATPTAPAAPTAPASDNDATSGSAPVVPAALQFSAPLVGGGDIELGALAGRPVLLWFWAPW